MNSISSYNPTPVVPEIRRGNTIPVTFALYESGNLVDASTITDVTWRCTLQGFPCSSCPSVTPSNSANPFTLQIQTTETTPPGVYFIGCSYTNAQGEQRSIDVPAFCLREHSPLEASSSVNIGPAGTIEQVIVNVDQTTGTPSCEVTLGGTPEARIITLNFSGLKGETPQITADEQGNIYVDGELLTAVVKNAADAANSAATAATEAAISANSAAGEATTAANTANTAASNANEATQAAQTATQAANAAAEKADTAASGADSAAGSATSAAEVATTAAESANSAAGEATTAANTANTAAGAANTAAGSANAANESFGTSILTGVPEDSITTDVDSVTFNLNQRTRDTATGQFGADTPLPITLPAATESAAGVLSAADKTSLDNLTQLETTLGDSVVTSIDAFTPSASDATLDFHASSKGEDGTWSNAAGNVVIPAATSSAAGLLDGVGKSRLDGIVTMITAAEGFTHTTSDASVDFTLRVFDPESKTWSDTTKTLSVLAATTVLAGLLLPGDKTKIDNIASDISGALSEAKEYADTQIGAHNTSDTAHADIRTLLAGSTVLPSWDQATYKLTFTTNSGSTLVVDLPIEKMDLRYNAETQSIEWDNGDGSVSSVPVSEFIKEYVGSNGAQITVTIGEENAIQASIVNNSLSWDMLNLALQQKIDAKADKTWVDAESLPARVAASLGTRFLVGYFSPSTNDTNVTVGVQCGTRGSTKDVFTIKDGSFTIPAATASSAGVMTAADKQKIDQAVTGGPYLPLSGGTMSGPIIMGTKLLEYAKSTIVGDTANGMIFFDGSRTVLGAYGSGHSKPTLLRSVDNPQVYVTAGSNPGTFTMWHSGNLTKLSQLTNDPGYIAGVNLNVAATALGAGTAPTVSWDASANKLTFGIPKGETGATGPQGPAGVAGADAGFGTPTATVDANVGKPSVTVTASGPNTAKVFAFAFKNLKGETGATGPQGPAGVAGADAGFGTPTATVDANVGKPSVTVTASGPNTAKVFAFAFKNLKGETGATGPQGPAGVAGAQGPAGATGPQGPQGPAGKDAISNAVMQENGVIEFAPGILLQWGKSVVPDRSKVYIAFPRPFQTLWNLVHNTSFPDIPLPVIGQASQFNVGKSGFYVVVNYIVNPSGTECEFHQGGGTVYWMAIGKGSLQ